MDNFELRRKTAQQLMPELYANSGPLESNKDKEYEQFCVAWDIPEVGVNFGLDHEFLTDDLENPETIARNAVQLLLVDSSLLYKAESRKLIGLPADEEVFLSQLHEMVSRLIMYDRTLSKHPSAELTEYPQDPSSQRVLAIGALTRWALNGLRFKFPCDSEYYFHDLDVEETYGASHASVSPIIPFIIRSQCLKLDPVVTPNQPDKVLTVLTQLIATDQDRSLYDKRKISNVQRAQTEALELDVICVEDILSLHRTVLNGIQDRAGRIRSGVILAGGELRKRQPPAADEVPNRLNEFVNSVNGLSSTGSEQLDYEAVARLAVEFQLIHPFQDANGRVGHILTNFLFKKLGLPLCIMPMEENSTYINSMDKAVEEKSYSDLISIWKKFSEPPSN